MIAKFLAENFLKPTRHPLTKKPSDYGMEYEDVEFSSRDGVKLKAWYMDAGSDKTLIVTHPFPFNRYGFSVKAQGIFKITNMEVELLNTSKHLYKAG